MPETHRPRRTPNPHDEDAVPPDGKTVLTALKTAPREHPVLIHSLCTYLSVTGLLLALMSARCHSCPAF